MLIYIMIFNNKRGWIRIVESVFAVLLIFSFVLLINSQQVQKPNLAESVYKIQHQALREVSNDYQLREEILEKDAPNVTSYLQDRLAPFPINFTVAICYVNESCPCPLNQCPADKEIYVDDAIISTNLTSYQPTKVVLFSWLQPKEKAPGQAACTENWQCTEWSTWTPTVCPSSQTQTRSRSCSDLNNCGTFNNMPSQSDSQSCTYVPPAQCTTPAQCPAAPATFYECDGPLTRKWTLYSYSCTSGNCVLNTEVHTEPCQVPSSSYSCTDANTLSRITTAYSCVVNACTSSQSSTVTDTASNHPCGQYGVCHTRNQQCTGSSFQACTLSSIPGYVSVESGSGICSDGLDNDCDNMADSDPECI